MKKKICLICPPSPFLLDERVFPFLGILKVAAAFQAQGRDVDVLDLSGIDNYTEVLEDYLASHKKDLEFVGVTATTPQMPNAFKLGQIVKSCGDYKLVLGGSHVTLIHTAMKREHKKGIVGGRAARDVDRIRKVFDILVCGDGELTLEAICETDNGVIDVDDRKSPLFLSNKNFSELPNPARHLIDLDSYKYHIEGERATSMISQLGCPFRCTFCSGRNSPYLRLIRNRSVDSVISEMEEIHLTYGYKGIMFYDDELNVSKSMVPLMHSICDLSDKYGVDFKLRGFTKAELFNEEQANAMYAAGFRWLLTGFESGDPTTLINIDKNATRDDNTRCVEIAKKAGLKVKALMSIGHAGETPERIENTKQWLLEAQPDDFDCTVITTYPGSPYFDDAIWDEREKCFVYTMKKTGDKLFQKEIDYTQDADYYKGVPGEYTSYVWTENMDAEALAKARDEIETEVRSKLGIPFNPASPARKYEHSMGSSRNQDIPDWILRSTETHEKQELERKEEKRKLKVL